MPENNKQPRYRASISFNVYADDDQAVIAQVKAFASKLDSKMDNHATVDWIVEHPFGKIDEPRELSF